MNKRNLEDYRPVINDRGKTEYEYVGPKYTLALTANQWKRYRGLAWSCAVVACLTFVILGLVDSQGLRTMYVALPYAGMAFPIVFFVLGVGHLSRKRADMTRRERDQSVLQMRYSTLGLAVLSAIVFLAEILLLLLRSGVELARELPLLLLTAALALMMVGFYRMQKGLPLNENARGAQTP